MNKYEQIEAVKWLAREFDGEVLSDYFGGVACKKPCYAITVPHIICDDVLDAAERLGLGVGRVNSSGRGMVFYWPNVTSIEREYNHMLDVAFTVVSEKANWEDLTVDEMIEGLKKRVAYLESCKEEAVEAFGHCDTFGVNDLHIDEEEAE